MIYNWHQGLFFKIWTLQHYCGTSFTLWALWYYFETSCPTFESTMEFRSLWSQSWGNRCQCQFQNKSSQPHGFLLPISWRFEETWMDRVNQIMVYNSWIWFFMGGDHSRLDGLTVKAKVVAESWSVPLAQLKPEPLSDNNCGLKKNVFQNWSYRIEKVYDWISGGLDLV